MLKFIIKNLKDGGEDNYCLSQDSVLFGRTNTCDIELAHRSISRKHAEITHEGEDYFLADLKSGNGTRLNGKKLKGLEKNLLRSGDSIQIEDYEILFFLVEDADDAIPEEDTDTDIVEIKLIKKMLKALGNEKLPSIEVLNGTAAGKKILFSEDKETLLIGRDPKAELLIDENVISRHHAQLVRKWGGIVLMDLESKNKVYVNNEPIEEKLLRDGDKIMFGTVKALYRNPKDFNLQKFSQEISRKKQEAAMKEAEEMEKKQREEERLANEAKDREEARQDAEARAVTEALDKEKEETEEASSQKDNLKNQEANLAKLAFKDATEEKPSFSTAEKVMIVAGMLVGLIAIIGLAILL